MVTVVEKERDTPRGASRIVCTRTREILDLETGRSRCISEEAREEKATIMSGCCDVCGLTDAILAVDCSDEAVEV